MATIERDINAIFADKAEVRQLVAQLNERMEFVPDPAATPQKAREMMPAEGIKPKDNTFSAELMQMRYEDD